MAQDRHYFDGEEYNGILLKRRLQPKEIVKAAKLMADVLYNYYIK